MKKIHTLLCFSMLLAAMCKLVADNDLSDLRGLTLSNAKIPIYNRSGKPQMMIFVNKAERRGRVISGIGTVLEFLRSNASVDDIKDAWRIDLYPLEAPFKEVFNFWLPRVKYSEAIVRTSRADIDQENSKATGSSAIYLRSPMLDLNGIGFEADFKRREIKINSEIEVLIRTSASDPRKLAALREQKYQYITATGDSLLIELDNKRITLIGSVKIKENQAVIECDRVTIEMAKSKEKNAAKKKADFDGASEISGISRLLADGSVVISGTGKNIGKVHADHLVYDLRNSQITLSGDQADTVVSRDELKRNVQSFIKKSPDEIPGYVVVDNGSIRSFGKMVNIFLNKKGQKLPVNALANGGMTGKQLDGQADALSKIIYPDGAVLCGKAAGKGSIFAVSADYCEYLPATGNVSLRNNVYAGEGGTEMLCDTADLKLSADGKKSAAVGSSGLESILCRSNVRLLHQEKTAQSGTLTADRAEFYPNRNKLVFYDNVRANHADSVLCCNQLEFFLADSKTGSGKPSLPKGGNTGKQLRRIIASGNVVMTDPRAKLNTGLLILNFRELLPGEKNTQSMLQAGNARLTSIECDNGINAVSTAKSEVPGKSGFFGKTGSQGIKNLTAMRSLTDMDKNISTLTGNVRIFDDLSMLTCDTVNLYSAARPAQKPVKEQVSDPDADPFALRQTENYAPSQILLTNDIELKKVECIGNVQLSRLINKQKIQAGGERADYNVRDRQIVISGKTPNRAWISSDGRKQLSDKLIYHLAEERFESSGDTETILKK